MENRKLKPMDHVERVNLLERALIKYIELYGFIDEAREYYVKNLEAKDALPERKH